MNIKQGLAIRGSSLLTALAFLVAATAPVLISGSVYAAGSFSPRKITLSSSANGNTSTDANGTAVAAGSGGNGAKAIHSFNFTLATTSNVGAVLLQYCDTPLFGTTCTTPTGLDASTVTSIASQSGFAATAPAIDTSTVANTGGFFSTTGGACSGVSPYRTNCILLKRGTAVSDSASTAISLVFGTGGGTNYIKNPTSNGTFYVRITDFSDTSYTTVVDQGAVAASINTGIDITAKVQEKLNFSVSAAKNQDPGTGCTALTGTGAITLGSGGVLDTSTAYDNHSYFRLSTNAANGTIVSYSGDTLKTAGGTNSITAIGSTFDQSKVGTSQFGLAMDSADTSSFGHSFTNLSSSSYANYNSGNGTITNLGTAKFALDTGSMTTPVAIASATSGTTVSCDTGSVRYLANVSPVTKPGVYQTTINYIATPTF